MAQNWEKHNQREQEQADDDLGRLIRWSLEDSLARETPPADLWTRIRARIESCAPGVEPALVDRKRRTLSLAPLIQTVVASSLVMAFALGIDRSGSTRPQTRLNPTTVPSTVVLGSTRPQDIPRIHAAPHPEAEQMVHQRIGGVTE